MERLREQRQELVSYMRLYCRAGTYDRFVQWENEARKQRQAARKAAEQRRAEVIEAIQLAVGIGFACIVVVVGFYFIGRYMGRW
jgi:type VI protein secretion system component VasF